MDNVLVYGSLFNGRGDIVHEIVRALRKMYLVDWIDPGIYFNINQFNKKKLRSVNVIHDAFFNKKYKYIFFISGGFMPSQELFECFNNNSSSIISWQLSDPDDYGNRGAILSNLCDLVVTNSALSYKEYEKNKKALVLDFACNPYHVDMTFNSFDSDYIVIGECRPDRLEYLSKLSDFNGAIYGRGWSDIEKLKKFKIVNSFGAISGAEKYEKINKSKIYISFGKTLAGGNNLKVGFFEALSVGAIIATDSSLDLLESYYGKVPHVFKFKSSDELLNLCLEFSAFSNKKIISMKNDNLEYFNSNHTWEHRIKQIIDFL